MIIDLPREVALKVLYDINEKGAYSNISLNKYLEGIELRDIDKGFITELVYGTLKWKLSIDWVIDQFSSVKLKKISPWILNILRLGVYQLLYTDRIPESAACNESVNLAKRYGHSASSRFVNGVLRNIARNKDQVKYPEKSDSLKYLSIKYSHPEWMVKKWLDRFGKEFTEGLLDSNNQVPDFTLRVNSLKTSKRELLEYLDGLGLEASTGRYVDEAIRLGNPSGISKLDAFKKGWFQVQDESSMLVAKVLNPQSGELVIDVCSAPGGKSTHIAELMKDEGTVIARDVHEHKIKLINEAVARLGLSNVKTEIFDATQLDERLTDKADRVLVDAPCTGLGIIRRKPDIKWTRNEKDKKEIIELQMQILSTSSMYVKPGGILVYSTCTIEEEENQGVIKRFLSTHPDFEMVDFKDELPRGLEDAYIDKGYIQIYPHKSGIDGFFISKMKKGDK